MLKNTLKLLILLLTYLLGLTFTLILIYASPDETIVYTFEASLFYMASAFIIFSMSSNISFHEEENNRMKYFYSLSLICLIIFSIVLSLIPKYAHPVEGMVDMPAVYIFAFSALLIFFGLLLMIKHNKDIEKCIVK